MSAHAASFGGTTVVNLSVKSLSRKWLIGASPIPPGGARRLLAMRLAVAAIAASAALIGVLPAVLFLDRGVSLPIVSAIVVFFSLIFVFEIRPTHLQQPGFFEFVAAWLTAISQGALVAFFALFLYMAVRGVNWLTRYAVSFFGWTLTSDWATAGAWIAYAFGGLLLIGSALTSVRGVWQALYPSVAGYATPFRKVARHQWGMAALTLAVIAVIAFVWFAFAWPLWRLGMWGCFLASVVLLYATMVPWEASQQESAPRGFTSAEAAVGAILRALGFTVVEQPRTGFPEFDPYLDDLDFAISRDDRLFAMLVEEAREGRPLTLHHFSRVAIAAHALAAAARRQQETVTIEAVLVVVGQAVRPEFLSFASDQDVRVIQIDPRELEVGLKDPSMLEERGRRLFRSLLEAPEDRPSVQLRAPSGEFSLSQERLGRS